MQAAEGMQVVHKEHWLYAVSVIVQHTPLIFVTYNVDIADKTCTCGAWQTDLYPCPHACAVKRDRRSAWGNYVSEFYRADRMADMYEELIRNMNVPSFGGEDPDRSIEAPRDLLQKIKGQAHWRRRRIPSVGFPL